MLHLVLGATAMVLSRYTWDCPVCEPDLILTLTLPDRSPQSSTSCAVLQELATVLVLGVLCCKR